MKPLVLTHTCDVCAAQYTGTRSDVASQGWVRYSQRTAAILLCKECVAYYRVLWAARAA